MNGLPVVFALLVIGLLAAQEPVTTPVATPPVATPSVAIMPIALDGYRLYPGDLLVVHVFDQPDLSYSIRVPPTGSITFPLIGSVDGLIGRTVEEMAAEIAKRLGDGFIRNPQVTISLGEFGQRSMTVIGAVTKPGEQILDPLAPTSAMQAIGKAGGFLETANRPAAQLVRRDPAQPGQHVFLPLPASDSPAARATDITLQPGDMIVVPSLDRVYVIGMVQKPGAVPLPATEPLTVSKAISLTGGFDKFARQSDVQVIRAGKRVEVVDMRAVLTGGKDARDPRLEPGDTIYVPESRL